MKYTSEQKLLVCLFPAALCRDLRRALPRPAPRFAATCAAYPFLGSFSNRLSRARSSCLVLLP